MALTASDPFRRHSDSDEYLSPLETTAMTARASSSGRRSESRPRSRSRRSRDDYDSDLLYSRDSEVSAQCLSGGVTLRGEVRSATLHCHCLSRTWAPINVSLEVATGVYYLHGLNGSCSSAHQKGGTCKETCNKALYEIDSIIG